MRQDIARNAHSAHNAHSTKQQVRHPLWPAQGSRRTRHGGSSETPRSWGWSIELPARLTPQVPSHPSAPESCSRRTNPLLALMHAADDVEHAQNADVLPGNRPCDGDRPRDRGRRRCPPAGLRPARSGKNAFSRTTPADGRSAQALPAGPEPTSTRARRMRWHWRRRRSR